MRPTGNAFEKLEISLIRHIEFLYTKEKLLQQWLRSEKVDNFDLLKSLMLREELMNCLPEDIRVHVIDQNAKEERIVAELADTYTLVHKKNTFLLHQPIKCLHLYSILYKLRSHNNKEVSHTVNVLSRSLHVELSMTRNPLKLEDQPRTQVTSPDIKMLHSTSLPVMFSLYLAMTEASS